jgi:hypothetical protein
VTRTIRIVAIICIALGVAGTPFAIPTLAFGHDPRLSSTSLTSSINPSTFGQSVTFTAIVSTDNGDIPAAVDFYEGNTMIGSAAPSPDTLETFTISTLSVGTHSITASFSGNGLDGASDSLPVYQVVNPAMTAARVTTFMAIRHGSAIRVTWKLAVQSGVIGFNVLAGRQRLNNHLIPVHPASRYRVTLAGPLPSHVTLMAVLTTGTEVLLGTR